MIKTLWQKISKQPWFYALVFWAVGMVILMFTMDWFVMPVLAGHLKSTVQIPHVVGLPGPEAEKILKDKNLAFVWDTVGRYSPTIPAGAVLIQLPTANRVVKEGRTVHLTVSKGLREVKVPSLRGKSLRQSEISLNRLGLSQGKIVEGAHISIPRGVVIRTIPGAGKLVRVGDSVDIVISAGKTRGRVQMPNLVGSSLNQAKTALQELRLEVGEVTKIQKSDQLPRTVISHDPRRGEYLDPGTPIHLVIAE